MAWFQLLWRKNRDIYIIFLLSFTFFFILKIKQYLSFTTPFEPADIELVLWNTLNGKFLQMPLAFFQKPFFAEHFSPILLLILPFYAIAQSPITLLTIHSLFISAAIIPLYFIVKEFTTLRWPPIAFSLAYFFSRTVTSGLQYDIHPEVLYPFIFFCMLFAYKKSNWRIFYLFLILSFMIKEDVFIATFGLGLFLLSIGEKKHGLITAGLSIIGIFIVLRIVIPFFQVHAVGSDYRFMIYWSGYGSTQKEILINFLNPQRHFEVIFTVEKLKQMFNLFSVFIFLPFVSWRAFVFLVLPNWFLLYSSDNSNMNGQAMYYGMLITPFLFFATILGIVSLQRTWHLRKDKLILILSSFVLLIQFANSRVFNQVFKDSWCISKRYTISANEFINLIPRSVPVTAQVSLVPHIPLNSYRSCFPYNLDKAEYVFLDYKGGTWPLTNEKYWRYVDSLKTSPEWQVISEKDDFLLLKRSPVIIDDKLGSIAIPPNQALKLTVASWVR